MPKDMYFLYTKKSDHELKVIRSKKYNRLQRLQSRRMGWFDLRESDALRSHIRQIDAILEARRLQLPMI